MAQESMDTKMAAAPTAHIFQNNPKPGKGRGWNLREVAEPGSKLSLALAGVSDGDLVLFWMAQGDADAFRRGFHGWGVAVEDSVDTDDGSEVAVVCVELWGSKDHAGVTHERLKSYESWNTSSFFKYAQGTQFSTTPEALQDLSAAIQVQLPHSSFPAALSNLEKGLNPEDYPQTTLTPLLIPASISELGELTPLLEQVLKTGYQLCPLKRFGHDQFSSTTIFLAMLKIGRELSIDSDIQEEQTLRSLYDEMERLLPGVWSDSEDANGLHAYLTEDFLSLPEEQDWPLKPAAVPEDTMEVLQGSRDQALAAGLALSSDLLLRELMLKNEPLKQRFEAEKIDYESMLVRLRLLGIEGSVPGLIEELIEAVTGSAGFIRVGVPEFLDQLGKIYTRELRFLDSGRGSVNYRSSTAFPPVTAELQGLLSLADEIRAEFSSTGSVIQIPHILTAANELGFLRQQEAEQATNWVVNAVQTDPSLGSVTAWGDRLGQTTVAADSIHRAITWSDSVSETGIEAEDDKLDITGEVQAMARTLASEHAQTPLTIGVFGDWGSGKSFFLELLEYEITRLTKSPNQGYLTDIVHVKFNAWQYVDGNLWANLTWQILDSVSEAIYGKESEVETARRARRALFEKLTLVKEQSNDGLVRLNAVKAQLEENKTDRVNLTTLASATLANLIQNKSDVGSKFESLLIEKRPESVSEEQFKETLSQFKGISSWFYQVKNFGWPWFLLVMLMTTFVFFQPDLTSGFLDQLEWRKLVTNELPSPGIASYAFFVTVATALTRVIVVLKPLFEAVTTARKTKREYIEAERERLQSSEARLNDEHTRLQAEISQLSAGAQLRSFIQNRTSSKDYREQLGIVATIREDFEKLEELINELGSQDPKPDMQPKRIVLYVDDLDRCPADRVVELLQALHLLMDIRLFVAVVAVDSRWLLSALHRYYEEVIYSRSLDQSRTDWTGSPEHYLEKIIQIPFAIKSMDEKTFGQLVEFLVEPPPAPEVAVDTEAKKNQASNDPAPSGDIKEKREPDETSNNDPETEPHDGKGSVENGNSTGLDELDNNTSTPVEPSELISQESPNAFQEFEAGRDDRNSGESKKDNQSESQEVHESVDIEGHEAEFIKLLHELVPTPRSVKRLINLYLLYKTIYPNDVKYNRHEIILFLLASIISYPIYSHILMTKMKDSEFQFIKDSVSTSAGEEGEAIRHMIKLIEDLKLGSNAKTFLEFLPKVSRFSFHGNRG